MANHFGQVIPADAGHSETPTVYGAVIPLAILATIAVIFRFVARRKSEAPISYEYVVFLYALNIDTIITAALWGLGKHFFSLSEDQLLHFQKNGLANVALYFTTNATIKISLLLLYYRLFFPSRPFRIALYNTAIIVVAWWIAVLFADIFQCVPVNAFWDNGIKNVKTARCMSTVHFSIGTGVINLVTDVMVLCLPIPMVWSLRTNRTQKIAMTGIFLLGFFVCTISIVRTVKLVFLGHFDPTYSLTSVFIWTSVQPSVGIISACLPIMSPLFGRWLFAAENIVPKSNQTPSAKNTDYSSQPANVSLAWPVKRGFTRLEAPTYRDQLETSYRDRLEMSSSRNGSVVGKSEPVANGSHGDKEGTNWLIWQSKGHSGDGRLEEGVQMREWPRRRAFG
ncbi:MAG: hypothetical protein ASARMPRED_005221 [Alectoria sarmentosa]|nr:MAG: hypothetical protein ASARMPRED_005221 [Alectoria sarmentosa]